jgi:hypothetical protein
MPAPQNAMLTQLAKVNFASKAIRLPTNWRDLGSQYPDAFSPSERMAPPNPPMTLFREATLNKYHVDTANKIGGMFEDYIEGICKAICNGIGNWMTTASIVGVVTGGPVGMVIPGNVIGPPLMPLIFKDAPKSTPQEVKYSKAISTAFGTAWQAWHMGISGAMAFPSLPYVPCPNVPMPLIALPSTGEMMLSPMSLRGSMNANLGDPSALHADPLFDAIAKAFSVVFQTFKASTIVMNVFGTVAVANGPPGCIK